MRCPYCHHLEDRVVDSRMSREGRAVRRRRECLRCGRRFTTYEYVEERSLQVRKRNGGREPYDREKLRRSIEIACAKRPIGPEDVDRMVDAIEQRLDRLPGDEVDSRLLGELVMEQLRERDHVAYVRFASVYRNFLDVTEFFEEIEDLNTRWRRRLLEEMQPSLPLRDEA